VQESYGWEGPGCNTPQCTGGCANGGICTAPDTCTCAPNGYYGFNCRNAKCGDGWWIPRLEKCDDGNLRTEVPVARPAGDRRPPLTARAQDGCNAYCRLEDPRLDPYAYAGPLQLDEVQGRSWPNKELSWTYDEAYNMQTWHNLTLVHPATPGPARRVYVLRAGL
jgi:hypothetical protein